MGGPPSFPLGMMGMLARPFRQVFRMRASLHGVARQGHCLWLLFRCIQYGRS
ncbi:hypothetical protein V6238_18385 [Marinomonas arenicola]|uniref:hypothetical protein n=1 Tax=Marinomonas arenicola TaxID=569601 RepID=UPI00311F7770